ncbi:MAG: ABC transporter permease, partial [Acidobacteriota bacterium]
MGLWQDVQFAARLLVKDRWFTLVAMLALAFGIGVNATVFTLVNAVLLRGLPVPDSDQVLVVDSFERARDRSSGVSYLDFQDWRASATLFTSLAAYTTSTMNLSDEGRAPERYSGVFISGNAFKILGQPTVLGRDFLPEDDRPGAPPVVILGGGVWKNRYGGDPSVIGRAVRINDRPAVIVGVMPEGFRFPSNSDLWQPLSAIQDLQKQPRSARNLTLVGRLKPETTREQAQAELLTISQRVAAEYPDTNKDIEARLQTFNEQQNGGPLRAVFLSLLGAVGFVLLIACANVANLLLARAATRAREISVRVSLGASRGRIVRQLLMESLLLALMSGVLGLAFALVGVRLFDLATQDVGRPYWIQFTIDGRVFAYFAAACIGTAFLFGLAPALHIAKTDVNEVLKEGGRSGAAGTRSRRWASALVIGELALTLVLLAGAGFMIRNFVTTYRMDIGIETSHLLASSLVLPDAKYPALEQRLDFYQRLQERLSAKFADVSVATARPMQGGSARSLEVVGRPPVAGQEPPEVTMVAVDPRYFSTIRLPVLRGRGFTDADGMPGQETAIVNTRLAEMHFADEDPIGRSIVLSLDASVGDPPPGIPRSQTAIIVGLVPNVRQRNGMAPQPDPVAYLPFRSSPRAVMTLLARSDGDPHLLAPVLREEMRAIDPDLPLFDVRTLDEGLARARWPFRIFGTMFAVFAAAALLLSAIGLYAVTAYSVTQRTQEIGVRTALGAQPNQVVWLFLRRAVVHLGIGLVIGTAGALGVGQLFEGADMLVQISGYDPITIGSIASLLAAVSLTAAILPTR